MVNKGEMNAVSKKDPQDKGQTIPIEKNTPSGGIAKELNNQDRGNKR